MSCTYCGQQHGCAAQERIKELEAECKAHLENLNERDALIDELIIENARLKDENKSVTPPPQHSKTRHKETV